MMALLLIVYFRVESVESISSKWITLRECIGQGRPMGTSINLSLLLLFNIDPGDERRCPCNALESTLPPDPRHLSFALAGLSSTSNFSVRNVFTLVGPQHAEDRLLLLDILIDVKNCLTIHFGLMDLSRCRTFGKMLDENGPGECAAKDPFPIPKIIDHAFSFPAHRRMARVDGFSLGITEKCHAHDE